MKEAYERIMDAFAETENPEAMREFLKLRVLVETTARNPAVWTHVPPYREPCLANSCALPSSRPG